jgi:hypothetical protein
MSLTDYHNFCLFYASIYLQYKDNYIHHDTINNRIKPTPILVNMSYLHHSSISKRPSTCPFPKSVTILPKRCNYPFLKEFILNMMF